MRKFLGMGIGVQQLFPSRDKKEYSQNDPQTRFNDLFHERV